MGMIAGWLERLGSQLWRGPAERIQQRLDEVSATLSELRLELGKLDAIQDQLQHLAAIRTLATELNAVAARRADLDGLLQRLQVHLEPILQRLEALESLPRALQLLDGIPYAVKMLESYRADLRDLGTYLQHLESLPAIDAGVKDLHGYVRSYNESLAGIANDLRHLQSLATIDLAVKKLQSDVQSHSASLAGIAATIESHPLLLELPRMDMAERLGEFQTEIARLSSRLASGEELRSSDHLQTLSALGLLIADQKILLERVKDALAQRPAVD